MPRTPRSFDFLLRILGGSRAPIFCCYSCFFTNTSIHAKTFPPSAPCIVPSSSYYLPLLSVALLSPQDILYLPALWYHRVSQKGVTVAVNYWHDMQFDHKYVYYRFLQSLAQKCRGGGSPLDSAERATGRPPVASEVEDGENEGSVR